ncbi:ferritin-like domain-containing protein [Dyella sp. RRB7]|uniref:ferritin-like domain-containing protein n=1 Tax=Dyella sp. RRB7 TaxID=2919502 RepID=UPI001FAA1DC8|nr:ferritin-like domain-containing protein [Dyella sp. RRB7]
MPSDATVAAADHAMRHWLGAEPGRIKVGSDAHKRLFCRMLLDTHNPYKPAVIEWPELSPEALHRITSLPIWDIAVQTEGRATLRVDTYTRTVSDPLLREALTMDGGEEARHKVVLSKMVEAYGIALAPEPAYEVPKDPEWGWLVTGYSECIDSFFAFGLFESARRTGYFPEELVETFEPVMQEEARHILFFANWVAWYRRQLPWWRRPGFELKVMRVWLFLIWERIGIAKGLDSQGEMQDANFTLTGHQQIGLDLKLGELLDLCLTQDRYRMDGYDARLLRPTLVPRMARLVRRFVR